MDPTKRRAWSGSKLFDTPLVFLEKFSKNIFWENICRIPSRVRIAVELTVINKYEYFHYTGQLYSSRFWYFIVYLWAGGGGGGEGSL